VEDSDVGPRTRIWQFASVIRGTILGADCNVASCALLDGARFGDGCIVGQGVAIGPGFVIGDNVFIGPNVTFCNDRWPSTDKDGFDAEKLRNGFVTIRVGNTASIGANSAILPGVEIGTGAIVAAGAIVNRSVPSWHLFTRKGTIHPIGSDRDYTRMLRAGQC
jgi:acetyltransferase-like isoleucine patch superfamily enzyme